MDFFLIILQPLQQYSIFISIISSLFGGEPAVLALAFLSSAKDFIDPIILGILAYTTAIIAESFWFLVGNTKILRSLTEKMTRTEKAKTFYQKIDKIENGHYFKILLLAHVFSGTTIIYVIRLGKRINYFRFLLYCAVVNIIWTPLVIFIGYSAGKGFTLLLNILESVHAVIGIGLLVLFVFLIIYYLFNKNIDKILTRYRK